jgi:hypothetical protein
MASYDDWISTDPRDRDPFTESHVEDHPDETRAAAFDVGTISVPLTSKTAAWVSAYAATHNQPLDETVDTLLRMAMRRITTAIAGGSQRWVGVSAEARSKAGRHAVNQRWMKYRERSDKGGHVSPKSPNTA